MILHSLKNILFVPGIARGKKERKTEIKKKETRSIFSPYTLTPPPPFPPSPPPDATTLYI